MSQSSVSSCNAFYMLFLWSRKIKMRRWYGRKCVPQLLKGVPQFILLNSNILLVKYILFFVSMTYFLLSIIVAHNFLIMCMLMWCDVMWCDCDCDWGGRNTTMLSLFSYLSGYFLALPCKKFSNPFFRGTIGIFFTQSRPVRRYFTQVLTWCIALKFLLLGYPWDFKSPGPPRLFYWFLSVSCIFDFLQPQAFLLFLFVLQRVEIPVE